MAVSWPECEAAGKPAADRTIDREVLSGRELSDVPVRVEAQPDKLENRKGLARLAFVWDMGKMPFRTESDVHALTLHLIWCLFDVGGSFVTGREGVVRFALTDATYRMALSSGLRLSANLEAAAGAYRLLTVVSEDDSQRLSAATQALELK